MIYYIADMHLGHQNIIRFDNRPFADIELMNEVIVHNWNAQVTEEDTIYILGDAFWKKESESVDFISRLNGHKHLIKGNHDRIHGKLRFHYESIQYYLDLVDNEHHVVLSHYPIPFYNRQHYRAIMLYGHVHNTREWQMLEKFKVEQWQVGIPCQLINVGCMMKYMNYTPRTLDELLKANPSPVLTIIHKEEEK